MVVSYQWLEFQVTVRIDFTSENNKSLVMRSFLSDSFRAADIALYPLNGMCRFGADTEQC